MTLARRTSLNMLAPPGDHAGLALEKLLERHDPKSVKSEDRADRKLLESLEKLNPSSPAYQIAFGRWLEALNNTVRHADSGTQENAVLDGVASIQFTATTVTPLAIGLGNASPLEVGLALHRTYGTPYLPGSALKGLARRAATATRIENPQALGVLFGEAPEGKRPGLDARPGSAGHVAYWDAWLEPGNESPFQLDTITVHHPKYYGSRGQDGFPTDFDDPTPVPFLSVKPGTRFRVILSSASNGPAQAWLHAAAEILQHGLERIGLGGKTNAGYG